MTDIPIDRIERTEVSTRESHVMFVSYGLTWAVAVSTEDYERANDEGKIVPFLRQQLISMLNEVTKP